MILAIDVYYFDEKAKAVCIEFDNWTDLHPSNFHVIEIMRIEDYISGAFYKRELPCIIKVLELVEVNNVEAIIIDGYVVLDDYGKLGLGGHLYEKLEKKIPIIGVAKKSFHNNSKNVMEIVRGNSKNPLFITSVGIELNEAAEKIKNMAGDYRIPSLLKLLDQKTKEI